MKKTISTFPMITYLLYCLTSCGNHTKNETKEVELQKNQVIVLGTIHSGHLTSEKYDIDILSNIIESISPDYILTEIPPDRFDTAFNEFNLKDTITEPRVVRFPEYIDVVFPLSKRMDFKIIPTAGWTKKMSDARSQRLTEIRKDTIWIEKMKELDAAGDRSEAALAVLGDSDDPYIIHSDAYDSVLNIELSVYNDLLNEELGDGGWDNINKKHYSFIEAALDKHTNQGKTILITYGAGHKGWFLKELRKRKDIDILPLKPYIDQALTHSKTP